MASSEDRYCEFGRYPRLSNNQQIMELTNLRALHLSKLIEIFFRRHDDCAPTYLRDPITAFTSHDYRKNVTKRRRNRANTHQKDHHSRSTQNQQTPFRTTARPILGPPTRPPPLHPQIRSQPPMPCSLILRYQSFTYGSPVCGPYGSRSHCGVGGSSPVSSLHR